MKKVEVKLPRVKRQRVEVVCISCKKVFKVLQYEVDKGRKYCSRECVANDKGFGFKIKK